jgi:hypothetical protein
MPRRNQTTEPPPDTQNRDSSRQVAEVGLPYNTDADYDLNERQERRDYNRVDGALHGYDEAEETRRRRRPDRSLPPPRDRRRDDDQANRRSRSRDGHRDRRSSSRHRERTEGRHDRGYNDECGRRWDAHRRRSRSPRRSPSPPRVSRSPSTGYTIINHATKKSFQCEPKYGQTLDQSREDLRRLLRTGDVISVRLCDFSSNTQAEIGEKFSPSSGGLIYVKEDVPFIVSRVEAAYVLGWIGRSSGKRGLRGLHWIPQSEYAKYSGLATEGDPSGSEGNHSPHDQLKVVPGKVSRTLSPTTHVFAAELMKVTLPRRYQRWGQLRPKEYYRLQCLNEFLTASFGSTNASIDSVPTDIGLDIDSLRTLRTAEDSLATGWELELAALNARQKQKVNTDDMQADPNSPEAQGPPMCPSTPPAVRPAARDDDRPTPLPAPPVPRPDHQEVENPQTEHRRRTTAANVTRVRELQPPTGPRAMAPYNLRPRGPPRNGRPHNP